MAEPMVCVDDFERFAFQVLPRNAFDYYRSGANDQSTLKDNVAAFKRWKLAPRVLRDVSCLDLSTTILGHQISFPVCVAATAMQCMAHPHGEVATAQAAQAMGTAFTLSTFATSTLEGIAEDAPQVLRFFQLFIYKNRDITRQLVRRAERAGFSAVCLTVDVPCFGKRLADDRNKFKLPPHLKLANFEGIDFKSSGVGSAKEGSGLDEYGASLDPSLTWKDIDFLKSITNLPIILKGILTAEDALLAVDAGVAAIIVSNHGARQLDTVPATIDVLPEIVAAVKDRCEVYMDGGVRLGTDVFKALALGAKAVFIGRPALYGLTYNGAKGVESVLRLLQREFASAMALSGCASVSDIQPCMLRHQTTFPAKL
ncbi:hypothetical protein CAPTEDRAFT_3947 [Capitella teleta]|uniref:(S)-2-hydroxy-acid oxidase n=1 Tax=Capitella teleta TaxID=283909 RepID=R7T479_CAPTE|nr:hypothetical protein CAPTEDRAFT_3947 [Capitella teleta]|eukprot:ELT87638.1 hypothetical protein CAPTEDRAFT_3947 [Capitella teleta]